MVKKGYKQTEVGVIPEDWADKKLGDVGKVCMCKRIFADQTSDIGEVPFFKIGTFGKEADAYISKDLYEDYKRRFSHPQKGDVLISAAGTLGRSLVFNGKDAYFQDSNIVWLDIDKDQLCNEYLYHYYKVIKWAFSEGSTIARLYNGIIRNTHIVLPDMEEQKQIAAVLSEMDELISLTEKRISKEKAIKQGAMQELLTGKRRLPGFNGVWQEVKLEDICSKVTDGAHESPPESDVGYYMPSVKDMRSTGFNYSECKKISYSDFKKLERNGCRPNVGDVLIAKDGSILKYAFVQEKAENIVILSSIAIITPHPNCVNSYFLAQYFKQQNFVEQVITNYKSGTGVPRIVLKGFKQIVLLIPESVAEQAAIAKILVDMDTEITGLENELAKYRQVKQCMMQQLLTGKIRLKNDVEDLVQAEQADAVKTLPARTAHNHQFDDAVSIAAIVDTFYSDKYPLGRVKVQKLLYLLHRHQSVSVSDFKKKAAGPYADAVRYKGGEPIAIKNKYVVSESGKQGTRYARGANMAQALNYVERWGMQTDLQWLKENFLHTSCNDLELFATVDMAMSDLAEAGISASVESIKNLIASNKEWKAKLSKTYFSDWDIARAIKKCTDLFD